MIVRFVLGLFFLVKNSIYAAGPVGNRVVLQAACDNAGVVVAISDLMFEDVASEDEAQTVSGSWAQSIFSSQYYGDVPFHGIVVEDANANCGITTQPNSAISAARYLTLSTDMLSGKDDSQEYMLEPNGHYDEQFDYETYKSYIHIEVNTEGSITALTGNGAQELVDENIVYAYDSFGADFLEKNLLERSGVDGDQRKGLFQISPEILLSLPGNIPDVVYDGALYINLYAQASEVVIDNGSGDTNTGGNNTGDVLTGDILSGDVATGGNSTGDGLWDLPIFHEFGIRERIRNKVLTLDPFVQQYFMDYLERLADRYEAGLYTRRYVRTRLRQIWQVVRRY